MRAIASVAALAMAVAALVVPAQAATAAGPSIEDQVFSLVNDERARAGLSPLSQPSNLASVAEDWSATQARESRMYHSSPTTWGSRLGSWSKWGENVAAGYSTAADVVNAWMASPGHRANILDPAFTSIGIGHAQNSTGRAYWTQEFAKYAQQEFGSVTAPRITVPSEGAVDGATLTVAAGSASPAPASRYQWLRNGATISGATGTSYRISSLDVGASISVRQFMEKSGYRTQAPTSAAKVAATSRDVSRVTGADRFETSVEISRDAYASGTDTVYIATGLNYPDALAAAPAAIRDGAPVLLVAGSTIPDAVDEELRRLRPSEIVVLGGDPSVSVGVERQLRNLSWGPDVTRITGTDRYGTSREIAKTFGTAPLVYLATGNNFPDALSAAAPAGQRGAPIVLVNGGQPKLDAATLSLLRQLGTTRVIIVGGTPSVSAGIERDLEAKITTVDRLTGADRWGTSVKITDEAYDHAPTAYLATGMNFPDALAGSVLAADSTSPLIITPGSCVPQATLRTLDSLGSGELVLFGGLPSLDANVAKVLPCGF